MNLTLVYLTSIVFFARCSTAASRVTQSNLVTVFDPSNLNYIRNRTASARSLLLRDGTILVSFDIDPADGKVTFPVYKSTDRGKSFSKLSEVVDQVNHGGLRYQSHMIQLTRQFAEFPAGTILFAGNAIPENHATTNLDLYASYDNGNAWKFLSTMATGGEATPVNGKTPVWEPYLLHHENILFCYYSDQRDASRYGQKMVHTFSTDAKRWSTVIEDVTSPKKDFRPGMPVVSRLSNGAYFMTYEYFGAPEGAFSIYYKISKHPERFRTVEGRVLKTTKGYVPFSSPYNVVLKNGWIVVNAGSSPDLFINKQHGRGLWEVYKAPAPAAYSRGLSVGSSGHEVMISAAAPVKENLQGNKVTFCTVTIQ